MAKFPISEGWLFQGVSCCDVAVHEALPRFFCLFGIYLLPEFLNIIGEHCEQIPISASWVIDIDNIAIGTDDVGEHSGKFLICVKNTLLSELLTN